MGSLFSSEGRVVSLIGEGTSVVGIINFGEGMVRLDGRLEGKVVGGGTLIVGEKGMLQGEMSVGNLILCGRVEGTVAATGSAHIAPTGKLLGKVQATHLIIEEGGVFDGKSEPLHSSLHCQR